MTSSGPAGGGPRRWTWPSKWRLRASQQVRIGVEREEFLDAVCADAALRSRWQAVTHPCASFDAAYHGNGGGASPGRPAG